MTIVGYLAVQPAYHVHVMLMFILTEQLSLMDGTSVGKTIILQVLLVKITVVMQQHQAIGVD